MVASVKLGDWALPYSFAYYQKLTRNSHRKQTVRYLKMLKQMYRKTFMAKVWEIALQKAPSEIALLRFISGIVRLF